MESIISSQDQDPEETFSFTCDDFNSAVSFFSDSEDDHCGKGDELYIEIALDKDDREEDHYDGEAEAFDLRISFSSPIAFHEFPTHSLTNTKNQENDIRFETDTITETSSSFTSSSTTLSCSSTGTYRSTGPPPLVSQPWGIHKSVLRHGVQFPEVKEQVNTFPFSLGQQNGQKFIDTNQWELVGSRKTSKNRTTINGGIMNLFIKFRTMKVRTLLATFMKPRQVISSPDNGEHKKKRSKERLVQRNQGQGRNINKDNKNSLPSGEKYPRVLKKNLDAIKGVIEAISIGIGRKDKQTKSCPTSINSSPIHSGFPSEGKLYSRETSIQAAIAHCKRSFGET